jgi:RNA polymerase sigma-70 factor (ECF subfamily)
MAKSSLRTNDEAAEIYARHVQTVYRVCFTYMKNAADTEDAVSEAFIKMLKASPSFETHEHEKAWLIRTATNVCKDFLKHWWRKREDLADYAEKLETCDYFYPDDVTDAIFKLPDKYKTVVYLYYFEGYSGEEIAQMLKKPHSTIRNHLREARNILRERLGEFHEE